MRRSAQREGAPVSLIGASVPRLEDEPLLRGKGRFIDDLHMPGMLEAAFVRSPYAHAVVRAIRKDAALALEGVHAVIVRDDLLPYLSNEYMVVGLPSKDYKQHLNRPTLPADEAVHVGQPVAMVIADNRYIAEDASALVEVDWGPQAAVGDCKAALSADAPKAHRGSPHNLLAEFTIGYGDVDARFAAAAHVFKEQYWQHRGGSHSIECRGTVAVHDGNDGRLTVWTSTQMPHAAQRILCDMLGFDENAVRVVTPDVGGGFGPKLVFYPEDVCVAIGAMIMGRPVKWIEDRLEHFVATTQERDQYWEAEVAVDADGRLLAIRGEVIHDHGAYTARGVNLPYNSAEQIAIGYELPAYRMKVRVALTNKVAVTPVRGAGHPQGVFVMERLLDRIARELKLDRAEVRRRNLVPAHKMPYQTGVKSRGGMAIVLDSGDYPSCQQDALERAGWSDFPRRQADALKAGRYLGIGIGNFVKGTGRGPFETVTVRIGPSGRILVHTGAAAMGQSTKTMLAQIVCEQLGGDMTNITVVAGDTGTVATGMGGSNSRQAVLAGTSAHTASLKVRNKLIKVASHLLEVGEQDLEIEGRTVLVKGADIRVDFAKVASAVAGTAGYSLPGGVEPGLEATDSVVIDPMTYANGTAVAEVEVDIETGAVRIVKLVFVHDCGRILHPMIVEGQLIGGIAHGIGNALFEWMRYDDDGQPLCGTLADYLLVTATEMPTIELAHHQSPTPLNPLGIKGVGECGVIPIAPAVISAVEDALAPFGARITRTPITPSDIVAMVTARKT
ncbi:MAG: xanthine dehydrogenase family protein molybdopterin-binding subunit [Casimicrobiaceae bacterium]